jgi:putative Holliday junction resolvase
MSPEGSRLNREAGAPPGQERPGRVLGVDLGSRRIGLAVSDERRRLASAFSVLMRGASHAEDHRGIVAAIEETGANLVVVGLPVSLSGSAGPAALAVEAEASELKVALPVPVELCDERYTTVVARRALLAGGRRSAARRGLVDRVAAAAILQTWLDRQRASEAAWGGFL